MIKKGSNVKVLVGKDKNKTGEIIELDRKRNRAKIKGIKEFNIGHFLIGESIFVGIKDSIKLFKRIIKKWTFMA